MFLLPSRTENSLAYVIPESHCDYHSTCIHSSQDLCMNEISCDNLFSNLLNQRHSGVCHHLPNLDSGTPLDCRAVNGSQVPSWRSQEFASTLAICINTVFMLAKTVHTKYLTDPTQVLQPSTY